MSANFSKLVDWYSKQCNGDWEHRYGFNIQTLDNPGLLLKIDLKGTALEHKEFKTIAENMSSKKPWLHCSRTSDCRFECASHPEAFERAIGFFVAWVDQ